MKNKSLKIVAPVGMFLIVLGIYLKLPAQNTASKPTQNQALRPEADYNKNGVWDRVEQEINLRFSNNQNLRKAHLQLAIAIQDSSSDFEMSKAKALALDRKMGRAYRCLIQIDPSQIEEPLFLEALIMNDEIRTKNYIRFNKLLSGELTDDGPENNFCEFEVEQ
jgi:hypothetical protein